MKKYLFCILAMALLLCSCATNKPAESVGKPETDVSSTQTQQKDDNLSSNTVTTKPEQTTDSSVESTVTDSKPSSTTESKPSKPQQTTNSSVESTVTNSKPSSTTESKPSKPQQTTPSVAEPSTSKIETPKNTASDKTQEQIKPTIPLKVYSDAEVKAEIAKHRDTNFDFRYNKQQNICEKSYNIAFVEVDWVSDYKKVTYKNDLGDTFRYDINSGKLCYADIKSAKTQKTADSIDISLAEKLAYNYISSLYDIKEYTLDSKETQNGYTIFYRRYLGKYSTPDVFVLDIGYDGAITYISDNTAYFNNFDLSNVIINEKAIEAKIEDVKNNLKDDEKLVSKNFTIVLEEGKLQLHYEIKKGCCAVGMYYVPLEEIEQEYGG